MIAPVHVIARRAAALGFGLAGARCTEAADGAEAAAAIAALGPGAPALVLIEDALAAALPLALRRQLARAGTPVLMRFPGPALARREAAADQELLALLQQAIGYRVRLR